MSTVLRAVVTTAPGILFVAYEDGVVIAVSIAVSMAVTAVFALIERSFLPATSAIDLLDSALVVVVFFPTGLRLWLAAYYLSLFSYFSTVNNLVLGLLATYDDLLSDGFLENDGLWCLLADDDGLWRGCFWAVEFSGLWISFKLIGGWSRRLDFVLSFVLSFDTIFCISHAPDASHGWWGAFDLTLDAVLADLTAGWWGRTFDLALDEAVFADFAGRWLVSFDDVLSGLATLLDLDWLSFDDVLSGFATLLDLDWLALALAVGQAHFGFVGIFLQTMIGDLVSLDGGVAAAWSAGRARFPVALCSVDGGHGGIAGWRGSLRQPAQGCSCMASQSQSQAQLQSTAV
jgi:hypothetical protein